MCVLFRTGALGPLMGSEDLCDAQFAVPVSVESIEVQSDHQGSLLLVFPCFTQESPGGDVIKPFSCKY